MKKERLLTSTKIIFLFSLILFFSFQSSFSQCVNLEPTGSPSQIFCKTLNSTIDDLAAGGGTIVWFDQATGGNQYSSSTPLFNTQTYYADDISGGSCSTSRLAVTVTISGDVPKNVDVFVGKCASDKPTIANLSATGVNIEWYTAQTNGTLLLPTDPLANGVTYWVQQTENGCVSNRLPTTVQLVDPVAPTVAPIQSFCYPPIPRVSDLQAGGTNVLWYDSLTGTIPLNPSTPLVNGDYWAVENSFPCVSTIRSQTTVILDAKPYAGLNGSLLECEIDLVTTHLYDLLGTSPLPDNTGVWSGPSALSGGYLGTFEPGINIEGVYTYTVSTTMGICPDETANVTVIINVTPPPTISNSTQSFCEIEAATVGDLIPNGPGVLWYDAQTNGNLYLPDDFLADGNTYWASQTDQTTLCESLNRNSVTVTINVTPPPTITNSSQSFCETEAATVADLIPNGSGVLWYDAQTNGNLYDSTDLLVDGNTYWASQTDPTTNCESLNRNSVTVTINVVLPPTITNSNQSFCEIEAATVADLIPNSAGILWYDAQTNGNLYNPEDFLADGFTYWASQTDQTTLCESLNRNSVTVTINVTPPPTITNSSQSFCETEAATVADLIPNGSGILWYDAQTNGNLYLPDDFLADGNTYWASQTDPTTNCESLTRSSVTVTISKPVLPTTSNSTQTFCKFDNPTIANLQVNASSYTIVWYADISTSVALLSSHFLEDGITYYAAEVDVVTGCESASRLSVTVVLNDVLPPTITNRSQSFCASDAPTVSDLQVDDTNAVILWYPSEFSTLALPSNHLLEDGTTYWASQVNTGNGCNSSVKIAVTITLTFIGTPTLISLGNEFCIIDKPTVADLNMNVTAVNGGSITWYDSYPNGAIVSLSEFLVEGETYYAIESDSVGCRTINPLAVTISLEACDQYDIDIYDGFSPGIDGINDTFKIGKIKELYPNFSVEFYNRWGNLVYTSNASKPDWNGRLNGDGELVPAGVYYFIIYFNKNDRKPIQRRLYISR